jgi:transposase
MNASFQELTDSQWKIIEKIINDQRQGWHPLRTMVNAILSINRTGTQWGELDSKYPPWQSVYSHFRQFKLRGIWEQLLESLVVKERVSQKREETPSLLANRLKLCNSLTKKRVVMAINALMDVRAVLP